MSNSLSGPAVSTAPKQRPVRMVKCQFPAHVYDVLEQIAAAGGISVNVVVGFLVQEHLGFLTLEAEARQADVTASEPEAAPFSVEALSQPGETLK